MPMRESISTNSFVFFDQPAQSYFPNEIGEENIRNTDKESVKRMFRLMVDNLKDAGFQVVITEHADINESWYQDMIVEKWWDGTTKLVLLDWIEETE